MTAAPKARVLRHQRRLPADVGTGPQSDGLETGVARETNQGTMKLSLSPDFWWN